MFISDFAIRRPIITVVTMLALVVFGLFALLRTDVDEFPNISAPVLFIGIPYPGASPQQVEREVVDRIEEAINSISGVDQIQSSSLDGFAQIIVTFVFSKDPDQAAQDVRDAISGVRADLPPEMKDPVIRKFDPSDLPIVSLAMSSSTLSPGELTILADPGITKELRGINGVAQVTVVGGLNREIAVNVHPRALQAAGVTVAQVVAALQAQNLAVPVGRINSVLEEQTIRLRGRLERPEDFENVTVTARDGQLIRLGQLADVRDQPAEQRSLSLYKGREAIGIDVTKTREVSTTRVADGIRAKVAEIQTTLPPGVRLDIVRDAGERVKHSVNNVEEALFEGAALTVLVVFLFLNSWRSTVITGLALPVSTVSAFIAIWALGFTLNTMSLLGLSLAIGILIDDAIVVRENIVRHIERGEDHVTASHKGTDEIGLAVTATTFSIVAVFAPVGFMSGLAGQWFQPFALTIACAVLVSLFVSFSLDPMLSAYWPDPQTEAHERRNWLARTLDRFNQWFDHQADRYKGLIAWALDNRWWMIGIAASSFVLAIALQVLFGGFGFSPNSDRSELTIAIETPAGSSLEYTRIKTQEVERIINRRPEVRYTYSTIGSSTGSGEVDNGNVYVRLVPKRDRKLKQDAIAAELRPQLARLGGVTAYVYTAGFGGNIKQIQVQIRGDDERALMQAAEQIETAIRNVPGVADIGLSTKGQRPELTIDVNRGLAATMGLTVGQIAQSLRPAFAGIKAGDWVDPTGKTRDVTVRLAPEARANPTAISQLPLAVQATPLAGNSNGGGAPGPATLPLGQVATVTTALAAAKIDHLNRDRVVTVGANTQGRSLGEVSRDVNARIADLKLPAGVQLSQGGQVKDQATVFGSIFAALGVAILFMYLILVVQFGSFLDPLAIMVSLPLSLIGVVLALIITGDTLNIMSLIGVMMLMGIVAKNAILLIDFAKWARAERGLSVRDALIEAGRLRLRPIMMTTLALIAGMIPVALGYGEGADFRSPLGRAVIGGVIASTLLTLVVIPTVYEIMDDWRSWLLARFRRESPAHGKTVAVPGD
jgi:hydrophobic/amphiphilic exporter-1 (mainly G- bacteria), HAE1 family